MRTFALSVLRALAAFTLCLAAPIATLAAPAVASADTGDVVIFGDSLAQEAFPVAQALLAQDGLRAVNRTMGGTAPCDFLTEAQALRATRPAAVIVTFSGNDLTPCMRPFGITGDMDVLTSLYDASLRDYIDIFAGVSPVVLMAPPKHVGLRDFATTPEWRTRLRALVFEIGSETNTPVYDGGTLLRDGSGWYQDRLACLPGIDCDTGTTQVRSADGLHLGTTDRIPTNSGAARYAHMMREALRHPRPPAPPLVARLRGLT